MLTRELLETSVYFNFNGQPTLSVIYLCAECGGSLESCEDPACTDEMHHWSNAHCYDTPCEFSVAIMDLNAYLVFDYDSYEEAIEEVEGYEEYTLLMYKHWGIK